jgi:hypothetical protein
MAQAIGRCEDTYSLAKELKMGDEHNSILMLQRARNCTLQSVINETVDLIRQGIEAYQYMRSRLPYVGVKPEPELDIYLDRLEEWYAINIAWGVTTPRYGGAGVGGPPVCGVTAI